MIALAVWVGFCEGITTVTESLVACFNYGLFDQELLMGQYNGHFLSQQGQWSHQKLKLYHL